MKFIQFADTHLDSPITGALNLPKEKRDVLRQDLRTAFSAACALVKEHKADVLLLPGDLFDYESILSDTAAFLIDAFSSVFPVKVFITPGNHDSLRPGSPYMSWRGVTWPENVHIFKTQAFETFTINELNCSITGIGHAHSGVRERLILNRIDRQGNEIEILLFHGSRDGYKPGEQESVIPFSDAELLNQGFTYSAIGHYHSYSPILSEDGRVKGAYSGCLQGRGLDEAGEKFALIGEIDESSYQVSLTPVEVAPRRIVTLEARVTGACDVKTIEQRTAEAVDKSGARKCDIVNIVLTGALSASVELNKSALESRFGYFHTKINASRLEPDYDLESLAQDSAASPVKSAFVGKMLELAENAPDDDRRRAIDDALYYGLSALDGRKPEPRDAD